MRSNEYEQPQRAALLSPQEAARYLDISPRTLWAITDDGDLPAIWCRNVKRYALTDLEAYVEDRRQASRLRTRGV